MQKDSMQSRFKKEANRVSRQLSRIPISIAVVAVFFVSACSHSGGSSSSADFQTTTLDPLARRPIITAAQETTTILGEISPTDALAQEFFDGLTFGGDYCVLIGDHVADIVLGENEIVDRLIENEFIKTLPEGKISPALNHGDLTCLATHEECSSFVNKYGALVAIFSYPQLEVTPLEVHRALKKIFTCLNVN